MTSCQDIWHHRHKGRHHSCRQNIQGSKDIQQLRCIQCIQGCCRQERHQPQAQHQQTSCQDIWLHRCKGRHHSYRQSIQESKGIQQLQCIQCIQGCCRRERHQPQARHQQTSCQCIWLHRCKDRHHSCRQSILGSRGQHIQHRHQHHSHKIHRGELGQPTTMVPILTPMEPDTLARDLLMLSLKLMLLLSTATLDTLDTPELLDILTPLDTLPTTMVPTLTPMEPDILARGLLMLSLRLMPLSSTATLDTLDTPEWLDILTPLDTLPTTMVRTLTPMVPDILARGLLMPSLRLMLLFSMETMDTPDMLDMLLLTPLDTLDTVPMVPTPTPMVLTPTLDKQLNPSRRSTFHKHQTSKPKAST